MSSWTCEACSFVNPNPGTACEVCGTSRATPSPPAFAGGGASAFSGPLELRAPQNTAAREYRLQAIAKKHDIRPDWLPKLDKLKGFAFVLVCDDSSSMTQPCDPGSHSGSGGPPTGASAGPFAARPSRWQELRDRVSLIVELVTALDPMASVDVYFLNRRIELLKVTDESQLNTAFESAPMGFSPLTKTVQHVLDTHRYLQKNTLLLIATDGEPTDIIGNTETPPFLQKLMALPKNVYVQVMACTDDKNSMLYLNNFKHSLNRVRGAGKRIDITDDFASERKEVQAAQGKSFHFSHGDFLVKCLLGPVDDHFRSLDKVEGGPLACCSIV